MAIDELLIRGDDYPDRAWQFAGLRIASGTTAADRYDYATMKVRVWQKDMAVIDEFAKTLGCRTPRSPPRSRSTTPR